MARKSTKTTENPTEQITAALDSPINLEWAVTAEKLNIPIPELQERFCAKLDDSTVFAWDTIPHEHQALVEAIARDLESEASVRRLAPEQPEEAPQIPAQPEPPVLEEEQKRGGKITRSKRQSTGITKKRKQSIGKQLGTIEEIDQGIDENESILLVKDAAATGIQIGQAQVIAQESARVRVRREAHKRTVAKLAQKAAAQSNYDPLSLLEKADIEVPEEMREDLAEFSAVAVGKFDAVSQEIQDNAWVNGYTSDFTNLDALLNLKD